MKPVVVKLSRRVQFSRPMEQNDLKNVLWGYITDVLDEILEMGDIDFHYLMLLFYSGVKNYMLFGVRDPDGAPLARGFIEGPVNAGTLEITLVAGGVDYATLETPFIKRALEFRKEA